MSSPSNRMSNLNLDYTTLGWTLYIVNSGYYLAERNLFPHRVIPLFDKCSVFYISKLLRRPHITHSVLENRVMEFRSGRWPEMVTSNLFTLQTRKSSLRQMTCFACSKLIGKPDEDSSLLSAQGFPYTRTEPLFFTLTSRCLSRGTIVCGCALHWGLFSQHGWLLSARTISTLSPWLWPHSLCLHTLSHIPGRGKIAPVRTTALEDWYLLSFSHINLILIFKLKIRGDWEKSLKAWK